MFGVSFLLLGLCTLANSQCKECQQLKKVIISNAHILATASAYAPTGYSGAYGGYSGAYGGPYGYNNLAGVPYPYYNNRFDYNALSGGLYGRGCYPYGTGAGYYNGYVPPVPPFASGLPLPAAWYPKVSEALGM